VSQQTMEQITQKIEQQPDITLKELIEEFNLQISPTALSKRLTKLDYTFKKRVFIQKNKKTPKALKEQTLWRENQPNLNTQNLVFLD